jgi:uncharacterized protein
MGAGKSMTPDERARELSRIRNGMIRKCYYLMHRRPLEPQRKAEVMLEHFQWIVELEKRGQIVFSGALFDREGVQGEGLTLLRARDWDEAERLAETDPFVMAGAVSFSIDRWVIGGGSLTVSISLSDQRMQVD